MDSNVNHLINGYLDDVLTEREHGNLAAWIEADPIHATQFAKAVVLHDRMRCELIAQVQEASIELTRETKPAMNQQDSRQFFRIFGGLAASLAVACAIYLWVASGGVTKNDTPRGVTFFATIAHAADVDWNDQSNLQHGDRVGAQTLAFSSGVVRLRFDDGVEVTLQGPAEYELTALARTRLNHGLLTATVPRGAKGFRVDTPSAQVTDLGTAFGIRLGDDGISNVAVFEGKVDVATAHSDETFRVQEGESVRVQPGKAIQKVDIDVAAYEKIWPISSGIERSTGAFRFTPPWPRRLRFVRSDDHVFVKPEGYATTLSEDLAVNISRPGRYKRADELSAKVISSGRIVRSFVLHYHPKEPRSRLGERIIGTLTFQRPVLGLVVLHEQLAASADRFPGPRAGELLEHRQLELTGNRFGDVVTLSDDRRTVSLDLSASGRFSDLVRVIVDASVITVTPDH